MSHPQETNVKTTDLPTPSAEGRMLGAYAAALIALAALIPAPARAAEPLVRFDGGIGSQPLRAGAAVNTVRGLSPGGLPWVISELHVTVRTDAQANVEGRGLLLAGGDGIATPAGQSVRARLFCGAGAAAVSFQTPLVALDPQGDFKIRDTLVGVPDPTTGVTPAFPATCATPTLLIINTNNAWFAAGIPGN
jgi:hypothetical protein